MVRKYTQINANVFCLLLLPVLVKFTILKILLPTLTCLKAGDFQ